MRTAARLRDAKRSEWIETTPVPARAAVSVAAARATAAPAARLASRPGILSAGEPAARPRIKDGKIIRALAGPGIVPGARAGGGRH